MKRLSKLLIAYDGSDCADAMLMDLRRAGLPAVLEAVVASIAYVFLPPPEDEVAADVISGPAAAIVRPSQLRAAKAVANALEMAEQAARRVKTDFPEWSVKAEAEAGTPAWELVLLANRLNVDLIAIGSHGHSTIGGRLILGSVSQRVLYDAPCPVRLARCVGPRGDKPIRIMIGFNGSPDSEAALEAVAARAWPPKTEARVISAGRPLTNAGAAEERLRAAGLVASETSRDGDPATVLVEEAEAWGADSIFVGTRNVHGFQHLLHGSVSSAVASRAPCSVEVVRASKISV